VSRRLAYAAALVAALLVPAAPASADTTLGLTAKPGGTGNGSCTSSQILAQITDDPSSPYIVPAGGGVVTQWQTETASDTPGSTLTFAVLHPTGPGTYKVLEADSRTIATPLPASGTASFTLTTPVAVQQGDTFGLYSTSSNICSWNSGSIPSGDTIGGLTPVPPTTNSNESLVGTSGGGVAMNVAVTLVTRQDARVTTSASSANARPGNLALLRSTVTNAGVNTRPITFTDVVPSGLTINQAVPGSGACTVSGQKVTCTIPNLAAGQSVPVLIVVTPKHAGRYTNTVSVRTPADVSDPNTSNNTAKATLKVSPPPCVVPHLKGAPVSLAKEVLKLLGCRTKIKRVSTPGAVSGTVLKTKPGPGTYAGGRKVTLTVAR